MSLGRRSGLIGAAGGVATSRRGHTSGTSTDTASVFVCPFSHGHFRGSRTVTLIVASCTDRSARTPVSVTSVFRPRESFASIDDDGWLNSPASLSVTLTNGVGTRKLRASAVIGDRSLVTDCSDGVRVRLFAKSVGFASTSRPVPIPTTSILI